MSEMAISFFTSLVSLSASLYMIRQASDDSTNRVIDDFDREFKEFFNNVLQWFNKINFFTDNLLQDAKGKKLTPDKLDTYFKELHTIRCSDNFYSNCLIFIQHSLPKFRLKKPFNRPVLLNALHHLDIEFENFTRGIFDCKNEVGQYIMMWNGMSEEEKETATKKMEVLINQTEKSKNALRDIFSRISPET